MKQAIRAIGIAIYVLWLVVIVFTVTAVYSAFQLQVDFSENPRTSTSGGTMTLLFPFSLKNKGFYDISDLNITTVVQESNGALISNSSTVIPLISSGNKVNATHSISITIENMASSSLSRLLFYDTELNIDHSLALKYAGVIPLEISRNSTMQWGAPLYNLTLGKLSTQGTNVMIPINFENHSFFAINGTLTLELFNDSNQRVGIGTTALNVQPSYSYSNSVQVLVSGAPRRIREAHLSFDTSLFSYGPVVFPID